MFPSSRQSSIWLSALLLCSLAHSSGCFAPPALPSFRTHRTSLGVSTSPNDEPPSDKPQDWLRNTLRQLAQLSLADYEWRRGVFQTTEADRMLEESLARLRGEDPTYVRPMDAGETKMGPLGRFEKRVVEWLSSVIDEEGRRARRIVDEEGRLVRPIESEELGPLGFLERHVVELLQSIRMSESERVRTRTLRPKDLQDDTRGPLGELEKQVTAFIDAIRQSELLRAEQSRSRGGEIVRPIDVPGPLGEFEMKVTDLIRAEQMRSAERERNAGTLVRPKDARVKGPLGEAEQSAYEALLQLSAEERERLKNIRRFLQQNRPMDADANSFWGMFEAFMVGLARAPTMLASVIDRVKELLASEQLSGDDQKLIDEAKGSATSRER